MAELDVSLLKRTVDFANSTYLNRRQENPDFQLTMQARVRPSRASSAFGLVFSIGFFFAGMFYVIPNFSGSGGFGWFGVIWTLMALGGVIYHGINTFTQIGIATEEVQFRGSLHERSPSDRIRELDELRGNNLISEEEYHRKRSDILEQV